MPQGKFSVLRCFSTLWFVLGLCGAQLSAPDTTLFPLNTSPVSSPTDLFTQDPRLLVGGTEREGHLSPGALVQLGVGLSLTRYTSFSVRSCSPGPLLQQVGADGDSFYLGVTDEGFPTLALTRTGVERVVTAPVNVVDNLWHHVFLRFELGVLSLGVDQSTTIVANTTGPFATFLGMNLGSEQPVLTIGGGTFSGCFLEGARVPLSSSLTRHTGVRWGKCDLPDGRNCSGYDTDPCFSAPCGTHGECVATNEGTRCDCFSRYQGRTCEIDLGPLCNLQGNQCDNQGICQEDWRGNSTTCACPAGFTGTRCESPVSEACQNNPCQNGGMCQVSPFLDIIECVCPEGVWGEFCENQVDDCASGPCLHGGMCSDLTNGFTCDCTNTGYRGTTCNENINECEEPSPCLNSEAWCYDLYGSYECACPTGYTGVNCDRVLDNCSSSPCQNEGQCVNQEDSILGFSCQCPRGFQGELCESNIDDCLDVICPENSYCMDGLSEYVCRCNSGFSGTPPNCTQIDDCDSNPCYNEGSCFDENEGFTCVCATGFTGVTCEENIDECAVEPCLNGATCTDGLGEYTCTCASGFIGPNCDMNIDECELGICRYATECIDTVGSYQCVCQPGWEGEKCDEDINECEAEPCQNGGTCLDRVNSYICNCLPGFNGDQCEMNRDECAGVTCLNGGTCLDGINNYTCQCHPAFTGLHCADTYNACSTQPCQNGANCITTEDDEGMPSFYCECTEGFEGSLCSNNINDCLGAICPEGRVCMDLINSYECQCPAGYTGESCSEEINECDSNPCQNEATCIDALANYTCVCPPGFTGFNCQDDINECEETAGLCNNGICDNQMGTYQCYCRPGFSGDHCNLEFDECLSFPCQNNASCINEINKYSCVCQPGFTGVDCETEIDECEVLPCRNGATCIDLVAAFSCACVPGFTDSICSTNIDECEPVPCLNEGQCTDEINNYSCNCSDTGFKGDNCEINIDDCEFDPCVHGGNCSDLVKDYLCNCYDGYTGKNCQVDIPECDASPCQNGGSCFEKSNMDLYGFMGMFSNFSYSTAGGYLCECIPGFEGENCEINIDECEVSPCDHGTCIDGINSYTCECDAGYTGTNCKIEIDECAMYSPCQQGVCHDLVADYSCDCYSGYGGKNCSVILVGCRSVECLNSGSCEALLFNESIHDFKCHCDGGFTGRYCSDVTTFSLDGNAQLKVNGPVSSGYSIELWFRTTLPSGVLAVGEGETYYTLRLLDGRVNLQSSLINVWDGIFAGEALNDGEWQLVSLVINDTSAVLTGGQEMYVHSIVPEDNHTSFTTTVLGSVPHTLRTLSSTSPFVGCMRDASVNGEPIIPDRVPSQSKVNIYEGCPRVEQCTPDSCHNEGECVDLWTSHECLCKRPYLGETCQISFTAATFGNEAVRDSLVTVDIPETDSETFRDRLDVSLMVRTRQPQGVIFYIGSQISQENPSYLTASLSDGKVVVKIRLGGVNQLFTVEEPTVHDGEPHLLQVTRIGTDLYVLIDDIPRMNETLSVEGDFLSQVMYLGGLPHTPLPPFLLDSTSETSTAGRFKRQLGTSNDNTNTDDLFTTNTFNDVNFNNDNNENSFPDALPTNEFSTSSRNEFSSGFLPSTSFDPNSFSPSSFPSSSPSVFTDSSVSTNPFETNTPFESNTPDTFSLASTQSGFIPESFRPISTTPGVQINGPTHFKGILQDIRVGNGDIIRLIQPFMLRPIEDEEFTLPGESLNNTILHNVLEGAVSDRTCDSNPCQNGATCTVTWNDYQCTCTFGFKGKDCHELEYCERHGCPQGSECVNLIDGYECLTDITMNGINSTVDYRATFNDPPQIVDEVSLMYRSQVGGLIFFAEHNLASVYIGLAGEDQIVIHQTNESQVVTTTYSSSDILDGEWHQLNVTFDSALGLITTSDNSSLDSYNSPNNVIVDLKTIILFGNIRIGSQQANGIGPGFNLIQENFNEDEAFNTIEQSTPRPFFRGCLRELRVGGVLLPTYSQEELAQNPAANQFMRLSAPYLETGCQVCYSHECQNGGYCEAPQDNYTCSCPIGFMGPLCEINIDDCVDNECKNGAYCRDGINEYYCECEIGYTGLRCEVEIDECESLPCANGGICTDAIGTFTCTCTDEYIGETCNEMKVNNCSSNKCQNDAQCTDLYVSQDSQRSGIADNYTCECLFGFSGYNCDTIIDYCTTIDCFYGDCSLTYQSPGWRCECHDGYKGVKCDKERDECEISPCQNRATCTDKFNDYECTCATGWAGKNCDKDIDECIEYPTDPCRNNGTCVNLEGSFICECMEEYCGQTCLLDNPCDSTYCENDGICLPECDEAYPNSTFPLCKCMEGWDGEHCELDVSGLSQVDVAIIVSSLLVFVVICLLVGLVFFCMMAKKKRATRGTYSPSRQEFYSPRVEMGDIMKAPPEERLI